MPINSIKGRKFAALFVLQVILGIDGSLLDGALFYLYEESITTVADRAADQ
tara:strand:+ start:179251 stop:179403 length:153 start_codon:yes stop_codon:yes gene_type:complete